MVIESGHSIPEYSYIQYTAVQCCVLLYTQAERGLLSRLALVLALASMCFHNFFFSLLLFNNYFLINNLNIVGPFTLAS